MENLITSHPLLRPLGSVLPYAKCMMVAIAITMLFGAGLSAYFPSMPAATGAGQMLLIAGSGWAITAILALLLLGGKRFDYIHAMGDVKQTGVLALLPASVAMILLPASLPVWIPIASVALSSTLMVRKHIRLLRETGIPTWFNLVWFGSLWVSASAWTFYFASAMFQ
jgi:hypothetical protein